MPPSWKEICPKRSVQQASEVSRDWQSWYANTGTMQLKERVAKVHSGPFRVVAQPQVMLLA